MEQVALLVHVILAVALIGLIMVQHGKGAEAGASFGSGASQTVFGSQGSGNFLTRVTAILVTLFFASCLLLGYLTAMRYKPTSISDLVKSVEQQAPVEPTASVESDIPKPFNQTKD